MNWIAEVLESRLKECPEHKFIFDEQTPDGMPFKEFYDLSGRVYSYLKNKGIGKEDFVLINLERGTKPFIALMGVLRCGAAFTITENTDPPERIEYIYDNCSCKLEINENIWEDILKTEPLQGFEAVDGHDAAYAVYTSGTTGNPKGIIHEYGNLKETCDSAYYNREPIFAKDEKFAFIASLNFAVTIILFLPIFNLKQSQFHVCSKSVAKNFKNLKSYLLEKQITAMFLPPSYIRTIGEVNFSFLKRILVASEPANGITPPKGVLIYNAYSMSESVFWSCVFKIDKKYDMCPIGKPQFDKKVYLFDKNGNEVKDGEIGELCFDNPYVRGYINLPEENKHAFQNGISYSNDLAKRLPNGDYVIIGRKNDMVKINGNRVEPAEVEAVIRNVLNIDWCGVRGFEEDENAYLASYYTADIPIDINEVREKLSKKLPYYMLPAHFIKIDKIPVNRNGKFDRKSLPIPELKAADIVLPETDFEKQMFDVVSKELKIKDFGVTTNLISMGLTSIKAIKLSVAIQKETNYSIRTGDILAKPYIREWINFVDKETEKIEILSPKETYPLTHNQLGIYIDWERNKEGLQYNIPTVLKLNNIEPEKLFDSLNKIIELHPYFKVHLKVDNNGEVVQKRRDEEQLEIVFKKLNTEPNKEFFQQRVKPFNLLEDVLSRFEIYYTENNTYLFMDIHHILFDGTSVNILVSDILKSCKGEELNHEKATAYDYSLFHNNWLKSDCYIKSEQYFDDLISDTESFMYPSVNSNAQATGKSETYIGKVSKQGIKDYCSKLGITENAFFATVLTQVFQRISREDNIQISTISSGRSLEQLSNTIGMFVQTLPLVCKASKGSIKNLLTSMQKQIISTINNDKYPYTKLVEKYGIKPNILYAYQGDVIEKDNRFEQIPLKLDTTKTPISINIVPEKNNYSFIFEYDNGLYTKEEIERLFTSIFNFTNNITKQKIDTLIETISLISEKEEQELIALGTGEALVYDKTKTFIDLFLEQVKEKPNNIAVVDYKSSITYSELDRQSSILAHELIKRGVKQNDFVAVKLPRIKEFFMSVIGIWKAGAAYVPIDTEYPQERINYMIKDSEAKVVIDEEFLSNIDFNQETELINITTPDNLAYMIYTSGSTGKPKGVMISQESLVACCTWEQELLNVTSDDTFAHYISFSFDASINDFVVPFVTGTTVHILNEETRTSMNKLHYYITDNKITILTLPTKLGIEFANEYDNLPIKFLTVGGEKLTGLKETSFSVINGYGPTEFTVCSNYHIINFQEDKDNIPIGYPVPNSISAIVDGNGNLLPRGVEGELVLIGAQISKGYWNRPELTKEKFADCPFIQGQKMYKTGDLVRWNESDELLFIGRIDNQVKLRGFRIELGEIESVLSKVDGIKSCVAEVKTINDIQHLVAYYVSENKLNEEDLKQELSKTLTEYMVPNMFVYLEKMPLTPNGKVDRKNLPLPQQKVNKEIRDRELTYFEEEIVKMLATVLKHNNFDIYCDFLELGLTSISAMKFTALIYKKFGCNIKVSDILNKCNILKLENILQKELLIKKDEKVKNEEKFENEQEISDRVELNSAQEGVYYDSVKNSNSTIYNIPTEIILNKKINENKIKNCLEQLFEHHKIFNCAIVSNEKVYLKYDKNFKSDVSVKEMTDKDYQEYKNTFIKPFELNEKQLYRCEVVKTELNIYILFDIHHIIFDGISLDILIKEFKNLYENNILPDETNTIFDYATAEKKLINSDKYLEAKNFFDNMLEDFETCAMLPPDETSNSIGNLKVAQQKTNTQKILSFCKKNVITPAQLFLSAITYTLSRYVNNKETFISTISSGRNNPIFNNTLGMFVKTLPFASKVENAKSVLDFIHQTGKQYRSTIENDIYTLTEVNKTYNYVPKILYTCQLGVQEDATIENTEIIVKPLIMETPKMPLAISIENDKEDIVINMHYDSDLYFESTIKEFAYSINVVINNFIDNCETEVEHISLIDEVREKELQKIRQGKTVEIDEKILHKRFEKCVDLYPDKISLITTDGEFTYKEIEENSNKIAQFLISKGIQIEDKVVFILPRTSKLIFTMLGILKSGACYIPCIPDYPKERIDEIVADSGAKFIICEGDNVSLYENAVDVNEILEFNNISRPNIEVKPNNLAYMIYTSGTTGKPKGVLIEHVSVSNILISDKSNYMAYNVTMSGSCLSLATIAFDMASTEIFTGLCNCHKLIFADEEQVRDVIKLTELINKTKPKSIVTTPSRMQQFIEWPDFCKELKEIECIICGAEGFPITLYNKLKSLTSAIIVNGYGPTENTMYVNTAIIDDKSQKVTIGKPIPNTVEFIADSDGNELPTGIMGELYIGGVGVARGYQNNKELTDKRFIIFNGERVYKSGDFAKWTDNGEVDILGRMDNQVKLRGLRIELDEVNGTILSVENITNSIVLVKKINGEENLCAYFTASSQIGIDKLKAHLSGILPHYMVPSFIMQLDKFPTNRNGKLNKQELPDFITTETKIIQKATNKIEQDFCEIFANILNTKNISITDNFFEIGGTSLLVTRVILEAKKLNYNINYGDVFNAKTPQNLAQMCKNISGDKNSANDEIENFDYSKINDLLKENNIYNFLAGETFKLQNVLLTGATGFLGIHILVDFLKNEKGKIYCLLRKGRFSSAEERLTELLMYYFGENIYSRYKDRIITIEGDITEKNTFKNIENLDINTVFNCAANVKHFSQDDTIKQVNYIGVLNLIELCKKKNIRLIQTSTTSISGFSINNSLPFDIKLDEQRLYYEQNLDNKYIYSKFLAERQVLDEISKGNLDGKIMRLGNLSSRNSDGEFQINAGTNSFMSRFRAFNKLGCYPYSAVNESAELSPIDCVARAIMLLATTPKQCTIFHPFNNHIIRMGDIISIMQNNGLDINFVEDNKYIEALKIVQEQKENAEILSSIVAYQDIAHGDKVQVVEALNNYTTQILYRLGYSMPITEEDYINKVFDSLIGLGFFE